MVPAAWSPSEAALQRHHIPYSALLQVATRPYMTLGVAGTQDPNKHRSDIDSESLAEDYRGHRGVSPDNES